MGMTLDEVIERYKNNAEYERTHGSLQGCLEFRQFAEWLTELKQLREQTRWIPVSESTPEGDQEILFSTKTGRVYSGKYYDDGSVNQWYSYKDKGRAWNNVVTAWQPFPKPYREDGDTE